MRDLLLLMTSFGPGFRPHPRIYTGFINDTGKELPTIIAFEDILEIGVNMT